MLIGSGIDTAAHRREPQGADAAPLADGHSGRGVLRYVHNKVAGVPESFGGLGN